MSKLTAKQEAFCLEIVAGSKESAGYRKAFQPPHASKKSINERASRLRKTGKIVARIAELQAPVAQAAQFEMAKRLKELAYAAMLDPADCFDEYGMALSIHVMPERVRRAIAKYEVDPVSLVTKIRFVDKLGAIMAYSKLAGDIPKDVAPPPARRSRYDLSKFSDEEFREYMRLRKKAMTVDTEGAPYLVMTHRT